MMIIIIIIIIINAKFRITYCFHFSPISEYKTKTPILFRWCHWYENPTRLYTIF